MGSPCKIGSREHAACFPKAALDTANTGLRYVAKLLGEKYAQTNQLERKL